MLHLLVGSRRNHKSMRDIVQAYQGGLCGHYAAKRSTRSNPGQEGDIVLVGSDGVFDNLFLDSWSCLQFLVDHGSLAVQHGDVGAVMPWVLKG